jgi:hypothetical protein
MVVATVSDPAVAVGGCTAEFLEHQCATDALRLSMRRPVIV